MRTKLSARDSGRLRIAVLFFIKAQLSNYTDFVLLQFSEYRFATFLQRILIERTSQIFLNEVLSTFEETNLINMDNATLVRYVFI